MPSFPCSRAFVNFQAWLDYYHVFMKQGKAPYLPLDALERTINAQSGHTHCLRDGSILLLSHYLGLRAKELSGLVIGDVYDFSRRELKEVVSLRASITKGSKFREVFLVNTKARDSLLRYLLTERGLRHPDAPLFLSQRGSRFSANTMQRLIAICYSRAGIDASSHSGRRSFATHLIQNGADIYSVQLLLGHSSIATTEKYFTSSPERLKRMASLLA